jgi:uncharacterized protein YndB with AHSA1/START domain
VESSSKKPAAATQEIRIERVFDAPRARIWEAWTDAESMKRWMGPKGYSIPICTIDLRVGGSNLNCMRSPEGKDFWSRGVYREIRPLERIVTTDTFADENGKVVPPSHYGMEGDQPEEYLVTVTFADAGKGKTLFTLAHAGLPAGQMGEATKAGWNESFDKLAESLR